MLMHDGSTPLGLLIGDNKRDRRADAACRDVGNRSILGDNNTGGESNIERTAAHGERLRGFGIAA